MEKRWYALHVKPRFEKVVAVNLQCAGYKAYLPMHRPRQRQSDRMRTIEMPLFPGYIFCKFDYLTRLPILVMPGVTAVVSFAEDRFAVPEEEILAVQSIEESTLQYCPWRYVNAGRLVRVESGPLLGLEGFALETKKNYRLIRSVNLLQRSVGVTVDRHCVTPIEQPTLATATLAD